MRISPPILLSCFLSLPSSLMVVSAFHVPVRKTTISNVLRSSSTKTSSSLGRTGSVTCQGTTTKLIDFTIQDDDDNKKSSMDDKPILNQKSSRRDILKASSSLLLSTSVATVAGTTLFPFSNSVAFAADDEEDEPKPEQKQVSSEGIIDKSDGNGSNTVTLYKKKSGLQYIELQDSIGAQKISPRYGQLVVISYTAYMKLPNDKVKQQFDTSDSFIIQHGNGKMIPGLDEGLHTMTIGSKRRVIIPPKLGFVQSGLGPLPELPWNRWKLNHLLDDMITQRGGNLIYDIELLRIIDNEADQGYYEDDSLTDEQLDILRTKLERGAGATAAPEQANQV